MSENGGIIPGHSNFCWSVSFEGVSLDYLTPTPSIQQKAYNKMVFSLTEYDEMQHKVPLHDRSPGGDTSVPRRTYVEDAYAGDLYALEGFDYVIFHPV